MSPTAAKTYRRARTSARPRVEGLESRALLSGNFPGPATFTPGGFTHTIELNTLVQDANNDGIVNLVEKNGAAGGKYEFQGTLVGPFAPFHANISIDVLNSAGTSIGQTTTINVPAGSATGTFSILVATGNLAEGTNSLKLRVDRASRPGVPIDLYPFTVPVNTTSVTAAIAPVTPDPRNRPVAGPIVVTFSGPINAATFTTSALSLTRGGVSVGTSGVTIAAEAGSTTKFDVGGLATLTTPAGLYVFSVDSTKVKDPAGNAGAGTTTDSFTVVAIKPPVVTKLGPIAKTTRNVPLSEPVAVEFEQAIDPTTFTVADLSLTREGGANLLPGAVGVTISSTSTTKFSIQGLAGVTAAAGRYVLTVDTKGIKNDFGDLGTTTKPTAFLVDLTAPVLTSIPADQTVTVLPTALGAVVVFPPPVATDDFAASPTFTYTPQSGMVLPLGVNTITVKAFDDAGNVSTATFKVTVVAQVADQTPPTVVSIVPKVAKGGASRLTVTYSELLNPASAARIRSYDVRLAGRDRKFGTRDDVRIRLISAIYDPSSRSVALGFLKKIAVGSTVRVTVLGTTDFAVTDLAGNRLGGGDTVASVKIKAPAKPRR